jgi:hypothetical protein
LHAWHLIATCKLASSQLRGIGPSRIVEIDTTAGPSFGFGAGDV